MATMPMRNPMETPAEDAAEMRRAGMNKGKLPGLSRLPRGAVNKKKSKGK